MLLVPLFRYRFKQMKLLDMYIHKYTYVILQNCSLWFVVDKETVKILKWKTHHLFLTSSKRSQSFLYQ